MLVKVPVMTGADCKVNPVALACHVRIMLAPEGITVSCGGRTGTERLNTVPLPELPPVVVVPYRVSPDKIKPACGCAPSLLVVRYKPLLSPVKLCRILKPVPLVFMANTVPWLELPP